MKFKKETLFESFWTEHEKLLKQEHAVDGTIKPEIIQLYIEKVRSQGCKITNLHERDTLRSALRYWASYHYRLTGVYLKTSLDKPEAITI